jgi:hypothetical protein
VDYDVAGDSDYQLAAFEWYRSSAHKYFQKIAVGEMRSGLVYLLSRELLQ